MNTINKIKESIGDFFKKRFINKELNKKFKSHHIIMNKRNSERLNILSDSLFRASKITKFGVLEAERKRLENENEVLFNDFKKLIDKHYKEREEKLKKMNEKLTRELKLKDDKINEIKHRISMVAKT